MRLRSTVAPEPVVGTDGTESLPNHHEAAAGPSRGAVLPLLEALLHDVEQCSRRG